MTDKAKLVTSRETLGIVTALVHEDQEMAARMTLESKDKFSLLISMESFCSVLVRRLALEADIEPAELLEHLGAAFAEAELED